MIKTKKEALREQEAPLTYNLKKSIQVSGLEDLLLDVHSIHSAVIRRFQQTGKTYGFSRVETPVMEDLSLYKMYYDNNPESLESIITFPLGSHTMAMRPEILPSLIRAYIQNKVYENTTHNKWMYMGANTVFNSKKNLVTEYELGLEIFGSFTHLTEAQTINSFWATFKALGMDNLVLEINHVGEADCQKNYEDVLSQFLYSKKYELCDNCTDILQDAAIGILRCSKIGCQAVLSEAPTILDYLEECSHKHFKSVLEAFDELEVPYQLNPYYFGQDGAFKTTVQISYISPDGKDRIILGQGGYHNNLCQRICGKPIQSFGFKSNLDSIVRALGIASVALDPSTRKSEVCLVPLGELAAKRSLKLFRDLTEAGVSVYDNFGDLGVKNQLKLAEQFHTPVALIMGTKEALDETVILRDVKSGMQEMFSYDKVVDEVQKRLGR